jgi:hypothetical protein
MFGYHAARREKKRNLRAKNDLNKAQKKYSKENLEREKQETEAINQRSAQRAEESKQERQKARQEGRAYAEDVLSRDVEGLSPDQRNAMQYEANQQIKRAEQSANRRLLGEQGMRGIKGNSGVAYAQQRDLQRLSNEARGQSQRDLDTLDRDLALKKLAAMFNIEQGEAAQSQLDRQMAMDELQLEQERKRQRYIEDQMNRLFSRV